MIVIYGPPASGKSHNKNLFAEKYLCNTIVEADDDRSEAKKYQGGNSNNPSVLLLTFMTKQKCDKLYPNAKIIHIDDALKEIGQKRPIFLDVKWIAA